MSNTQTRPSQKDRTYSFLTKGFTLSANQLAKRLNTSASRARFIISELRDEGVAITTNRSVKNDGTVVSKYSLYA